MSEETQDVVYEASNDQTNESEDNYGAVFMSPSSSVVRPQPGHTGGSN